MNRYAFSVMALWLAACAAALPAQAQETPLTARYAVRLLRVKVGEIAFNGALDARRYTASAQLRTTGLAGALKQVHFLLSASGVHDGPRFAPERYSEEMDTGRRQSQASLLFSGGVARVSGTGGGTGGGGTVPAAQQAGAVDPMTVLLMVLRDQPRDGLCQLHQRVFDGERLSELVLVERRAEGDNVVCAGLFRRLAGYSAEEMAERQQFPLRVTYAPEGGTMRAVWARVETIYGPADLVRR